MRAHYVIPAIPALAMLLMPFLPFVNTPELWFGLPRMLVWGGFWCLMITPSLLFAERMLAGREVQDR